METGNKMSACHVQENMIIIWEQIRPKFEKLKSSLTNTESTGCNFSRSCYNPYRDSHVKDLSFCHKLKFLIPIPDGGNLWLFKIMLFEIIILSLWQNSFP